MTTPVVLSNLRGPEGWCSGNSSRDVADVLRSPVLDVGSEEDFKRLIASNSLHASIFVLATHGGFCENGILQQLLSSKGLLFTHSDAPACAIMSNKNAMKALYVELGIATPAWMWAGEPQPGFRHDVPIIRKPICGGSKNGLALVSNTNASREYLFEEYIDGSLEVSVYVVGSHSPIILPALARSRTVERLGDLAEWGGELSTDVERQCCAAASRIHSTLHCRGITKTDFVVGHKGQVFAIETDSHPALGKGGGAARQAARYGISYGEMIGALLND